MIGVGTAADSKREDTALGYKELHKFLAVTASASNNPHDIPSLSVARNKETPMIAFQSTNYAVSSASIDNYSPSTVSHSSLTKKMVDE